MQVFMVQMEGLVCSALPTAIVVVEIPSSHAQPMLCLLFKAPTPQPVTVIEAIKAWPMQPVLCVHLAHGVGLVF